MPRTSPGTHRPGSIRRPGCRRCRDSLQGPGATQAAAPPAAVAAAVIAVLRTGSPQAAILAGMPALRVAATLLPS